MNEKDALGFLNTSRGIPTTDQKLEYTTRAGGSWLNVSAERTSVGVVAEVTWGDMCWRYEGSLETHKEIKKFTSWCDF